MIICQIEPWEHEGTFNHISTLWEIATDEDFTNIIESVTTYPPNLTLYTSSLVIPAGDKYYLRTTMNFRDGMQPQELPVKELKNMRSNSNNNIIHRDFLYVEKPFVYLDEESFNDPDQIDFEISTSSFRCKQDGHVATHWIITDSSNAVIFSSLYNRFDKTRIRIEKTQDLVDRSILNIHAIHVSTNGVESEIGSYKYVNGKFQFDIVGMLKDIVPLRDHSLFIYPAEYRDTCVSKVYFKTFADDGSITRGIDVTPAMGSNEIIIPGEELKYDSTYYLDAYGYDINGEYNSKRIVLTTKPSNMTSIDVDIEYEKKIDNSQVLPANSADLPIGFVTTELPNGTFLLPRRTNNRPELIIYKTSYASTETGPMINLDFGPSYGGYGPLDSITLSSSSQDNIMLRYFNNGILLIDNFDTSNTPSFLVYRYDLGRDEFTLMHTRNRADETLPLGITNNLFQISDSKVWYLPPGEDCLKEYDFMNNILTTVKQFTEIRVSSGTAFLNRRLGKVILFTNNSKVFAYDIETGELVENSDLPFTEWSGSRIKTVYLPNGDILLLNVSRVTSDNACVYYDCLNNSYTPIKKEKLNYGIHSGCVTGLSSSIYFINEETDSGGSNRLRYEVNRLV